MRRFAHFLISAGLACCLLAGLLLTATPASAVGPQSLDTPTPPLPPTPEPTVAPSATPGVPPSATPSATPGVPPTATPRPTREPEEEPSPTLEPTATPTPTAPPQEPPDVVIHKTADRAEVEPGGTVVYTLAISNRGGQTAYDVVVSDEVPPALEVIDLWSSKGDVVVDGQTVTAYVRELQPGEEQTIRVTARVRPGVQAGSIPNIGIITTSTSGDPPGNNTSTVTIQLLPPQAPPSRLPPTAETLLGQDDPLLGRIPPALWAAIVGVLLIALGIMMRLVPRPRSSGGASVAAATMLPSGARLAASTFRLPQAAPISPPRLGPALPPAQPPAALPPLAPLDRSDALQDAISDGEL